MWRHGSPRSQAPCPLNLDRWDGRSRPSRIRRRTMAVPAIYVDADACPVKDEILKVAERHGLPVTLVSNGGLRPSRDPMVRHVVVSKGADAADDWIAENARAND